MVAYSHTFAELVIYEPWAVNSAQGFYTSGTPRCHCDYCHSRGTVAAHSESSED